MKLQPPSQITVWLYWVAATLMALKAGIENWPAALATFPQVNDWAWLSFVPLALLGIGAAITVVRSARHELPAKSTQSAPGVLRTVEPTAANVPGEASASRQAHEILPEHVSTEFIAFLKTNPTTLSRKQFLRQYEGKWLILSLTLASADHIGGDLALQFYHREDDKDFGPVFVWFNRKWDDHFHSVKAGDTIRFIAKIQVDAVQQFADAEPA